MNLHDIPHPWKPGNPTFPWHLPCHPPVTRRIHGTRYATAYGQDRKVAAVWSPDGTTFWLIRSWETERHRGRVGDHLQTRWWLGTADDCYWRHEWNP